jgi:hypothetical protein
VASSLKGFFGSPNWYVHHLDSLEDDHHLEADTLLRVLMPIEESLRRSVTYLESLGPPKDEDDDQRIQSSSMTRSITSRRCWARPSSFANDT